MTLQQAAGATWRVHLAGRFSKLEDVESFAKTCGAFESGYAGTLYFAFREAAEARRFAAFSELNNPKTAVIVVNV
ncbi:MULTISPECIES: hypothetical protein [unclassified Beijerinckia]|uniref:hypothetical protein n=1 Tax=unclassified Beijerinckia TaxID=2638183 RepID=UPI0008958A83|nr:MULTISPECIES: hypothetical protein [unclassified Beijerinckia]MDH7794794.1 hypothetical protein [Beijerinckia sp. GAS462]SEB75483.1 hypothetical protein SAMN05443249_1069 [Beijerinckia sp. 28-YEA-48]